MQSNGLGCAGARCLLRARPPRLPAPCPLLSGFIIPVAFDGVYVPRRRGFNPAAPKGPTSWPAPQWAPRHAAYTSKPSDGVRAKAQHKSQNPSHVPTQDVPAGTFQPPSCIDQVVALATAYAELPAPPTVAQLQQLSNVAVDFIEDATPPNLAQLARALVHLRHVDTRLFGHMAKASRVMLPGFSLPGLAGILLAFAHSGKSHQHIVRCCSTPL